MMTVDKRTQNRLDQALHALLSFFFADPFFSERQRELAEVEGHTHLEHVAREITTVLLRDFRIDSHLEQSVVQQKVERRVYDVLFGRLIGWDEADGGPCDPGEDILDCIADEILQSLITKHRIQARRE
jgi:hypothetical protein